ncbi:MAG TPA: CaiB/BaiF CoA-transferase family protein, partial [Phenylobacterium sp.]
MRQGPLTGLKIVEFAGIGPGPFCGMLLSDLGADVVRIDRKGAGRAAPSDVTSRGRRSVALDLKTPEAVEACLKLMDTADAVIEGFRPGVMERLGLGPDVALARNPKLVFGRMTGWGQTGPYAQAAGHDMNYIAITGALHAIGTDEKPTPPLNLVGDFGGGALYLAFGLLAGVIQARETGKGQVIDCAMSDGAASLMAMFYGFKAAGMWQEQRRSNLLDGGAHFYDTYRCSDGKWVSIGAIEPQFYALLLEKTGIDDPDFQKQHDRAAWPALREKLAQVIARKTRDEWTEIMGGTDVCFAPVLDLDEAPNHPHNAARETFVSVEGVIQP